ncbi:MAG: 3-oxoadipate enol-lactonase [Rubrobacteraceae bacterium]
MTAHTSLPLHHTLEGPDDAPVLVLSSSLGTTLRMWDPQVPVLKDRFRLLRYDHRGHGGSPAPPGPYAIEELGEDVLRLLDRLAIERFSFCGLSLGGMVGMWLASEVSGRVERLVLCCTSAKLGPPENWASRAATVREDGMGAISEAVLERWFTRGFLAGNTETAAWAENMLLSTPAEGYAGCCEAIRDMDLRGRLAAIGAPTLVIAGADDEATTLDHAEFISDSVAGSHLVVIEEAAHLANVQQPEAVTRSVLDHLAPVYEPRVD